METLRSRQIGNSKSEKSKNRKIKQSSSSPHFVLFCFFFLSCRYSPPFFLSFFLILCLLPSLFISLFYLLSSHCVCAHRFFIILLCPLLLFLFCLFCFSFHFVGFPFYFHINSVSFSIWLLHFLDLIYFPISLHIMPSLFFLNFLYSSFDIIRSPPPDFICSCSILFPFCELLPRSYPLHSIFFFLSIFFFDFYSLFTLPFSIRFVPSPFTLSHSSSIFNFVLSSSAVNFILFPFGFNFVSVCFFLSLLCDSLSLSSAFPCFLSSASSRYLVCLSSFFVTLFLLPSLFTLRHSLSVFLLSSICLFFYLYPFSLQFVPSPFIFCLLILLIVSISASVFSLFLLPFLFT